MVKVKENLEGRVFGKLTVVNQVEDYISTNGTHQARWLCKCECGNKCIVWGKNLKNGHNVSCGCYHSQRVTETHKKRNEYVFYRDYVVGYTDKKQAFYVSIEDFDKIKDICWYVDGYGYVIGNLNNKAIKMHRFILNCPPNMVVDHIGGKQTRNDNRRFNLRVCSSLQNSHNQNHARGLSGYTGVTWCKKSNKWHSRICIKGKRLWLGSYDDINDAIEARVQAEQQYFKEYSHQTSQLIYEEGLDGFKKQEMEL